MYKQINLDYKLASLYPYLNYNVINIHYNDIYLGYLTKLNQLLLKSNYTTNENLDYIISNIDDFSIESRGEILYYACAVLNHNLYFYNISNKNNIYPIGKIKDDINKYFLGFTNFKEKFIEKANNLKGSGYTFLVLNKTKLMIINTINEDSPYLYGYIPIICLDLWEHAYYLQYQNNRSLYIANFFNIIDFVKINDYYEKILQ